jgi:O-antigen/teichoic acid export membrane protein
LSPESRALSPDFDPRHENAIPSEPKRGRVPILRRALAALRQHVRDPVYANGYALVANAGLSALLGFLFWIVAARRFTEDALGVGAAVVSAATLAALIGKAGFDAAIIRYGPALSRAHLRRLLARAGAATFALTAFVSLVVLLLAVEGVASLAALRAPIAALGFVLLAVGTGTAWVLDAYFVSEQAGVLVLARNVAFNALKLVAPFFVAASLGETAVPLAWGLGLAASLAFGLAVTFPRLARHPDEGEPAPASREMLAYAARNYALNLSEFLPGLVFPLLVIGALGPAANARFYLAWTVATVALQASKAVTQSSFAQLVRPGPAAPALRKALLLSGLVLGPMALGMFFLGGFALGIFGDHYAQGAELLRMLALSVAPVAIANVYLSYLKARRPGWELTLLPALTMAALLVVTPLALAKLGVLGLGATWLAVQLLAGAWATVRLVPLLRRKPLDNPRTALRGHPHEG